MLSPTDYWISWAIIGALVGVMSLVTRRSMTDALFTRMFDGVIGTCVGGELIRRWDASLALAVPGLLRRSWWRRAAVSLQPPSPSLTRAECAVGNIAYSNVARC